MLRRGRSYQGWNEPNRMHCLRKITFVWQAGIGKVMDGVATMTDPVQEFLWLGTPGFLSGIVCRINY